jgi:hypothetical protein
MGTLPMRRVGAAGAVAFVVLNIVAFAIIGSEPDYGASATKIAAYFSEHHKALLVSGVLLGIGLALAIGAFAQCADMLRGFGFPDAAFAFGIAGAALISIGGVGVAILASMSQMAKSGVDPETVRAFYQAAQFMLSVPCAWIGLFLLIPLTRVAMTGALPRWVPPVNGVLAILLVLGGISVRGDGVLAVGSGLFAGLANLAFLLLLLEIAALLWRTAPAGSTLLRPAAPGPASSMGA